MWRFTSVAAFSVTVMGGAAGGASFSPSPCVSGATAVDIVFTFRSGVVQLLSGCMGLYSSAGAGLQLLDRGRLGLLTCFGFGRLGLLLVVLDRRLDGVLGQHGAVDLHRRQRQFLDDGGVLDPHRLFHRLA